MNIERFAALKERAYAANLLLVEYGLVTATFGNVSELDRQLGVMVIKPSGVPYSELTPHNMVAMALNGEVLDSDGRPSSDTPTHLELYHQFPEICGVVHTHAKYSTAFAQAGAELPCLGTTHADTFHGAVPVTRALTEAEVTGHYEKATGEVIAECFQTRGLDPSHIPGVLVHSHGPFTWGSSGFSAVENARQLETVAETALYTHMLTGKMSPIKSYLLDKHFLRKHGKDAYYGQPENEHGFPGGRII